MGFANNIKNLQVLLNALNEDHLSKADFTDAIKQIIDVVKVVRDEQSKLVERIERLEGK